MDKREWPTRQRLEDLRKGGVVPYSKFVSRCLALACLAGAAPAAMRAFAEFTKEYLRQINGAADSGAVFAMLNSAAELLRTVVILPLALVVAVILMAGLFQTKFMLHGGNISFNLGRLPNFSGLTLRSLFGAAFWAVAALCLLCMGGAAVLYFCLPAAGELLNHEREYLFRWARAVSFSAVLCTLVASLILALCALLMSRVAFMMRHRMSTEELDRESGGEQ